MGLSVQEITQKVEKEFSVITQVVEEVNKVMVGQRNMIDKLLIGILGNGHILVEGVPGLAKTTAIATLAKAIQAQFSRIQFTPDLLPADLIGTQIYSPKDGTFSVKKGPVFANVILADEINRAPAKVQSALLEAMQERQVTIGDKTFALPAPFLVMATQNPVEQEGTYPLPEAQVDRFMLKVNITYPEKDEEIAIMKRMSRPHNAEIRPILTPEKIMQMREVVDMIFVDEKLYDYVANLVFATRNPESFGLAELKSLIEYGASPRASIYLIKAAKAYAFLQGRGYVTPQDIKNIAADVMRHRVIASYEAEAQDFTSDDILVKIFDKVDVP
ncbi:MAG: ATPase [Bdellovibrionales bacterium RIFOXYD12_FULL_39_22]|nr:MAG: ATPase [Bdellovibrionales bacterium RIFOXYB1_FULL_39_21]OFZ42392.1 MAG: ATPase [Bdellovibrionales bacterium RIFOXYC12_FULL_39_17]OFZ46307.1 MAG: ATPase [Bdellovibrionales bacterium RIFOXYC1_FULL_39_130]OFZ75200.1 MAG: ATPase [Bdellovibrionales bacterium RIFOXYD1_FULL_39_84]OFZ93194.1 MAG: ATPase [Bdellovibrionales bacterium RIFOXYD12_FULL_39_22]HLE11095.1 AAA family ATPase [Bacteriovoracaceae bacterium]